MSSQNLISSRHPITDQMFNVVQPISKQPIRIRKPKSSGQNEYILSVKPDSSTVGPIEPDRLALPVCRHEGSLTSERCVSKGGAVLMSAICMRCCFRGSGLLNCLGLLHVYYSAFKEFVQNTKHLFSDKNYNTMEDNKMQYNTIQYNAMQHSI
ncbi:hypothetical protein T06_2576 [Trichinella sp. T6]|nr:hypothetical protein T06_2576 [Trichinella sp. T6]